MKKFLQSHIVTTGLAIFSMFFGAGNLIYPLEVGMQSGTQVLWALIGFLATAACLPVLGLFAMILFDGDYKAFFNRLGASAGSIVIFISLLIIGPLIAIPRIITLSHTMTAPFMPLDFLQHITPASSLVFSLIFLGITFLLTFRENNIVDVLGNVISPLLLAALAIIIGKGIWFAGAATQNTEAIDTILLRSFSIGYETLDLLAAIFFSSIVLNILRKTAGKEVQYNQRDLAVISLKAGILGGGLLALVYIGMSLLGVFYGQGIPSNINSGELFSLVSFKILGANGALIIATAVLMACLSTAIALCAVIAEYIQYELCNNRIGYIPALIITMLSCLPLSIAGLKSVLLLTAGPICYIGYPVIIMLTFCNIAYKLFDFKPIKAPVLLTFILALISYIYHNPFTFGA